MNEINYIPISDSDSSTSSDEQDDFETNKPKPEPLENMRKQDPGNTSFEDADNCPICFDSWTSTGAHKLCCLKCGHLFGYSCILKWIKSQGRQARCPQCNRKAVRHDIRFLYTKCLRAIDTSERDRALADLALERAARRKAEQEASEQKAKCQLLHMELAQLRDELQSVRAVNKALERGPLTSAVPLAKSLDSQNPALQLGHFDFRKTITISPTGNCRVMAACDYLNLLCVSQPSTNPIFRGFGVRKVHTVEHRLLKYIHLHQQPIRDLAFHPDAQDGLLLSVSLDKSVRLTSLLTDQVVQTYHCDNPVWSCCWASPDPNRFFAGCSNGSVLVFDIRITSGPLSTLAMPENHSPVIGLQFVPRSATSPGCGLLVGQLTKVTFMKDVSPDNSSPHPDESTDMVESHPPDDGSQSPDLFQANQDAPPTTHLGPLNTEPTFTPHGLPLEGCLASLSLAPNGRHFLASCRPSQRIPRVRHLLAELVNQDTGSGGPESPVVTCNEVHSLWAGSRMKMLTRARVFDVSDENSSAPMLVTAGSEDVNGALVWRCDDGTRIQTLQPQDATVEAPIIDCCAFRPAGSNRPCLTLLSERSVHFYEWVTSS